MSSLDNEEDKATVPESGSDRETESNSGPIFIVVACTIALIVAAISIGSLISDPENDKTITESYKNLAKKETISSPFPTELTANFTRLRDRWGANGPVSDNDLAELAKQHKIEALQLNYTDVTEKGLSILQKQPLRMIVMSGSPVTGKELAALSRIPTLRRVNIFESTIAITDDALSQLTGPRELTELTLRKSALTERGIAFAARTFKKLETLDLMYSQTITDKAIDPILEMPALNTLNLSFTDVTNHGIIKLAAKKSIAALHISGLGITDSTIPFLLENHNLERLNISESHVTDKTLALLARAKSIRLLVIGNCKLITQAGVEAFRRARPDCDLQLVVKRPVSGSKH